MPGLLLAPYNDSMRLGQGYNSFLQTPCVDNAVTFDENKVIVHKGAEGADGVSQVVSYSSRFVEKISDVVRSMNISAGSSIKAGSIEISGNSLSVDETKFAASDLNAVVSVKVVNQTTTLVDDARFRPMENVKMDSEKFFDYYGDCYISGFIEGGDLHGIVSIKVLEGTNKKEVEKIVKGKLNGGGGSSGGTDRQFNLSEGIGTSGLESALSQTETTVTVNWSGGGQIKSETEEWTLDSLFKVAAAFPAKVAACPQRTWAILTKYDNNRDFLQWSERQGIVVPNYQGVQSYASDLLDMYMEYKNNVARIQAVLSNPLAFRRGPAANAVNISVQELLNERKAMKKEMSLIVKEIDQLCLHPYRIEIIESRSTIRSPELWATRLPILKDTSGGATQVTPQSALDELAKFSFVSNAAPSTSHDTAESLKDNLDKQLKESMDSSKQDVEEEKKALEAMPVVIPQPAEPAEDPLCESDVVPLLSSEERKFIVDTPENRVIYGNYRYGAPCGSVGGGHFNDAPSLRDSIVPVSWPTSVEFNLVHWGAGPIVGWLKLGFEQLQFTHGNDRGSSVGCLKMTFSPGEYMTKIRLAKGTLAWGVEGVIYVEILTSHGQHQILGSDQGHPVVECLPPSSGKFPGIKGFYGCRGDVIDRLGPIWGHE